MRSIQKRLLLGAATLLVASAPAWSQDAQDSYRRHYRQGGEDYDVRNEFRLWLGGFRPDGHSAYWDDVRREFDGSASDFQNVIGGGDFVFHLAPHVGLMVSASYWSGSSNLAYRNFLDQNNSRISHDASLDITSGTVAVIFWPAPPHSAINPYLGGGGGIYGWRLRESGDFIDFTQASLPVFTSTLVASGTTGGYFFVAGADIPVGRRVSLFFEGRYTKASDTLNKDFGGFGRIDLSGGQIAGGVSFHL